MTLAIQFYYIIHCVKSVAKLTISRISVTYMHIWHITIDTYFDKSHHKS